MSKILCSCGKMLARRDGGIIWLWCKSCKKEEPFRIKKDADGNINLVPVKIKQN